jgi:hypothetical protein
VLPSLRDAEHLGVPVIFATAEADEATTARAKRLSVISAGQIESLKARVPTPLL